MFPFRRRKQAEEPHRAYHLAVENWLQLPRESAPDAIPVRGGQSWRKPDKDNSVPAENEAIASSQIPSAISTIRSDTPAGLDPRLILSLPPTAFEVEPYRIFGHLVKQLHVEAGLCVLAISSPSSGDGKTSTAINLACMLAQEPDARVLLMEVELRCPAIGKYLGLKHSSKCLTEGLLQPVLSLGTIVQHFSPFNFDIALAGRSSIAPYELLKSLRFGSIFEEARKHYDYVIVDTPPLLPFADCRLIEKWIDGLLVVVAAHQTSRKLLKDALEVVDPAKLVGLVLNKDDYQAARYDYAYRYYTQPSRRYR